MHPDPILHVDLPQLPAGAPSVNVTLLLPGVLADAANADLMCLIPGPRRCSARVLQPVTLAPQPGRVQVVDLLRFGGVSFLLLIFYWHLFVVVTILFLCNSRFTPATGAEHRPSGGAKVGAWG